MSHFIGTNFQPSSDTHTCVYNYEHITGGILIIIWDYNLKCPKIRPVFAQGHKN